MDSPFFSVLLPAFNARQHIAAAIQDILRQSWRDFELLVVDDGSTDGTADVVRKFPDPRIRLLSLPENQGLVGALNHGLDKARGRWVARQDADDRCRPDRLQKQAAIISKHPDAVLVYSHARLIDSHGFWRGRLRPPVDDAGLRWDLCFRNPVPHTSAVFPLSLAREQLQGYRNLKACEDYDLWSRLLHHGNAFATGETLVSYRIHSESIMGRAHSQQAEARNEALRGILVANLRNWAGANLEDSEFLASAWLNPDGVEWERYFEVTGKLSANSLNPPDELLAEQDYSLLHKTLKVSTNCAQRMLDALRKISPARFRALPTVRTFLTRLLHGI